MQSINTFFKPDTMGKEFTIVSVQDVEPVLKSVEHLKHRREIMGDMEFGKHVARIPIVFLKKWGKEDGINYFGHLDQHKTMKLFRHLNDPEYKKLRVWGGHLGIEDTNQCQ